MSADPYLVALEARYPFISWREPIPVSRLDGLSRWGCRICIAHDGLKGTDIPGLFLTKDDAAQHIKDRHHG